MNMKIKIDGNLPAEILDILKMAGYNAESVFSEGIQGCSDQQLINICREEQRILFTLDYDFASILSYPPDKQEGIIVFSVKEQSRESLIKLVKKILPHISEDWIPNCLWIVEDNRICIRSNISSS